MGESSDVRDNGLSSGTWCNQHLSLLQYPPHWKYLLTVDWSLDWMEQQGVAAQVGPHRTPPHEYYAPVGCQVQRSKSSSCKSILGKRACVWEGVLLREVENRQNNKDTVKRLTQIECQWVGALHHAVAASRVRLCAQDPRMQVGGWWLMQGNSSLLRQKRTLSQTHSIPLIPTLSLN